jgi:hypothetical protein
MGVTGMDIMPGFQNTGTWYDYFEGTSFNVSDAAGHSINLGPGEYKVFTTQQFAKPFHYLNFSITDSETQQPISMANISLSVAGTGVSGDDGTTWFTAEAGTLNFTVSRSGYYSVSGTVNVPEQTLVEVSMTVNPNGVSVVASADKFVYPNPATGEVYFANLENGYYRVFDLYGKLIKAGKILSSNYRVDIQNSPEGVYLVKVLKDNQIRSQKIVIQ